MVEYEDILRARERLDGHVVLTPCTPSQAFGELFGGRAWFKFENLQRTGSFKERGAVNSLSQLSGAERARGVIAASAGNHAQAIAYHATRLGVPATIVMPRRTPLIKVANTERYGATVVLHGANYDEAMAEALRLREESSATLVHAFDDARVIAGQGTIGLELLEQAPEIDVVVVPIGGGGLMGGIALALKHQRPEVRLVGVEVEALPAAKRAREEGRIVTVPAAETIADGIAVRRVGVETYPLIERYVDDLVTVSEEEVASAVLLLLEREKTVAEPACATVAAAVVNGHLGDLGGREVCMVLSGGNIDVNLLSRIIDRGLIRDGRLARLTVRVLDRPGALATLTTLLAEQGANILHLRHHRGGHGVWLTEVDIDVTLETRGPAHIDELDRALREQGYQVQHL